MPFTEDMFEQAVLELLRRGKKAESEDAGWL